MEIKEIQNRIVEMEKRNGWVMGTADAKMTFLIEEVGELAKWVRKARAEALSEEQKREVAMEFADVLQHIFSLANMLDIDIEQGLQDKGKL